MWSLSRSLRPRTSNRWRRSSSARPNGPLHNHAGRRGPGSATAGEPRRPRLPRNQQRPGTMTMGQTTTEAAESAGKRAGQDGAHWPRSREPAMHATNTGARHSWRRILPSTARTRIMGWVLLLVMAALGIVTFVTWRLLVSVINDRMDKALRVEVQEFAEVTAPGSTRVPANRSPASNRSSARRSHTTSRGPTNSSSGTSTASSTPRPAAAGNPGSARRGRGVP